MAQRKPVRSYKAAKPKKITKPTKVARTIRKARSIVSPDKRSDGLTPRQKEILKLVSQGNTNRDIARRLEISVRTVEVHRFNLMRRLKVRNVAQLLRQALQQGFLPKNFAFK
jgi:DNA-binding NarL/FixJ family response regulator